MFEIRWDNRYMHIRGKAKRLFHRTVMYYKLESKSNPPQALNADIGIFVDLFSRLTYLNPPPGVIPLPPQIPIQPVHIPLLSKYLQSPPSALRRPFPEHLCEVLRLVDSGSRLDGVGSRRDKGGLRPGRAG